MLGQPICVVLIVDAVKNTLFSISSTKKPDIKASMKSIRIKE